MKGRTRSPHVVIGSQKFVPLVSGTTNNSSDHVNEVVIGSQKFVPLVSGTTSRINTLPVSRLWLALKSLYLWYLEQRESDNFAGKRGCDWLSKVCTFGIWNNHWRNEERWRSVVIGSQKFVPLVSGTTPNWLMLVMWLLWLALKSLYLWYLEQLFVTGQGTLKGCDWLSKVCTFGIWNNQ